jgi:hypothetical protein
VNVRKRSPNLICSQFLRFVADVPKYLSFATFSKNVSETSKFYDSILLSNKKFTIGCGTETGDCYNLSRLEECVRKGGGQFEDVLFKN